VAAYNAAASAYNQLHGYGPGSAMASTSIDASALGHLAIHRASAPNAEGPRAGESRGLRTAKAGRWSGPAGGTWSGPRRRCTSRSGMIDVSVGFVL
jgi:hypothetical protein